MLFLALFTFLHIHFTVIFQVLEVFFVVIHTIHYPHFHSFFKHEIVFSESFFGTVVSTYLSIKDLGPSAPAFCKFCQAKTGGGGENRTLVLTSSVERS